ncbi:hypothetical protein QWA_11982 [Alcaligenes faecalis subsp. faecalis NCIB 8687]|uniref:L-threonylcarbamoyladenylate synthase n=1 Tax=Alcaligenes sp. Lyrl_28 TaxID=3110924 RepID=UPI000269E5B6|nr:hypothetical protein QWA_11982 [Alcaligenes faecalis subsp. faecalis NCIB 8687]
MTDTTTPGPSEQQIEQAAHVLAQGGLVAFPTETVYGLGADAENPAAVQLIYKAKGRPANHPLIVHVAPGADLRYWVKDIPAVAQQLIDAFWPGPLTLILPRNPAIPDTVSGGQSSIGIRCPSHPVAQALLKRMAELKPSGQAGVAAPSANKFGQVSPTAASHVRDEFVDMGPDQLLIVEAGPSEVGIESTIVDVSRTHQGVGAVLLRPGHITAAMIAEVIGYEPASPDQQAPQVSGSLKAHYAPRTPLSLFDEGSVPAVQAALAQGGKQAIVAFAAMPPFLADVHDWYVCSSDAQAYAQDLYAMLRRLDQGQYQHIWVQRCPDTPDWQAVNDRLGRAAAAFE